MKYILSKKQHNEIMEGPFDSFKNRMEYHLNVGDRKKYPGRPSYNMYVMMKAYQNLVDRIFRYTIKEFPFEGVKGLRVASVFSSGALNREPDKIDITLWPILDDENPFKGSQEEFDSKLSQFKKLFKKNVERRTLNRFWPLDDSKKDVENFFSISPIKIRSVMLESFYGSLHLKENYTPSTKVKRRLSEIEKVLKLAMDSSWGERDFEDFVEIVLDYIWGYFTDYSGISEDEVAEITDYVRKRYLKDMDNYFFNHKSI
jgi:hypothetical protein